MKKLFSLFIIICIAGTTLLHSQVWQPDLGNGKYKNPIIMADYSDPDACRVGDDYYMVSSSFNCVPGLQILHSLDLVNWTIISAALPHNVPYLEQGKQLGKGVWAPAIRHHDGIFYIFYGDPDKGIISLTANRIEGPWQMNMVMEGKGLIDPCPFWDEDGRVWLVHALAGSRAALKSVLLMAELDSTATKVIAPSRIIFDGHQQHQTCEGPKLYKRNHYYYIFHPAGGVRTGWQTVLRSKNIYGPYEAKIVLTQGKTNINGPHQGAWVTTQTGEDWFLHFQDRDAYGRVVHLQPMIWQNDWPIMGKNGEPVLEHKKPNVGSNNKQQTQPQTNDEFDTAELGLQWQWMGIPQTYWHFCNQQEGLLRLYSVTYPQTTIPHSDFTVNDWLLHSPNLLMQKLPAETFTVTTKLRYTPNSDIKNETAGLVVSGKKYHYIGLRNQKDKIILEIDEQELQVYDCKDWIYLQCRFSNKKNNPQFAFYYSVDGKHWTKAGQDIDLIQEKDSWIGNKIGLFCLRPFKKDLGEKGYQTYNDGGSLDIDFWHVEK